MQGAARAILLADEGGVKKGVHFVNQEHGAAARLALWRARKRVSLEVSARELPHVAVHALDEAVGELLERPVADAVLHAEAVEQARKGFAVTLRERSGVARNVDVKVAEGEHDGRDGEDDGFPFACRHLRQVVLGNFSTAVAAEEAQDAHDLDGVRLHDSQLVAALGVELVLVLEKKVERPVRENESQKLGDDVGKLALYKEARKPGKWVACWRLDQRLGLRRDGEQIRLVGRHGDVLVDKIVVLKLVLVDVAREPIVVFARHLGLANDLMDRVLLVELDDTVEVFELEPNKELLPVLVHNLQRAPVPRILEEVA
mmetsp:Transcript_2912/g.10640  ORF Transcript_2912/g.10640 Transcript_2912/m.10640 type:complete len:315 (-) Transcript_2912:6029-6973(-)